MACKSRSAELYAAAAIMHPCMFLHRNGGRLGASPSSSKSCGSQWLSLYMPGVCLGAERPACGSGTGSDGIGGVVWPATLCPACD